MLSFILSVVSAMFCGMIWYSPDLGFGKVWAANAWPGKTLEQIGSTSNGGMYVVAILGHVMLLTAYNILMRKMRVLTINGHLVLMFCAALMLVGGRIVHVPFESVPMVLILIDTGYDCFNMMMCSIITYALAKRS